MEQGLSVRDTEALVKKLPITSQHTSKSESDQSADQSVAGEALAAIKCQGGYSRHAS